ncbi:MAG: FtsH protease activity modulator HflK [Candidatus Azotimanducaceae bacterium]|uniref:Protein HflK n=1 Tax=OM182 bacterium TaxID=2510334 RepID=A0A520S2N5_9GAMM|nr:FtsH protease activity modulator HflK [Gammaproteobacteria bacterium]OUV68619.1 MAG: HflK protein [Gammaproteobacteria bacterium TMED133]RZO76743.1 MAG: FtsH protease activity modulator HflK [OM182 bacterium]
MAWNEPGGGKDRDPWGNGGDQGPPDLDEAFRKLQNSLSQMFGGKSSIGGSGGSAKPINFNIVGLGILLLVLIYLGLGVYQVDEQEKGVVLRFGKLTPEIIMPGLHWNPPLIDRVLIENVTRVRSRPHDSEMLTEDENIVKVKMTVQYVISDIRKYKLQVKSPDQSLYQSTESALRHVVGSTEMHQVLTEGRAQLASDVRERIQTYMERYGTGIQVTQVNIEETAPPDAVRAAFDDVIKAREDEVRLRNEADAYANQVIPEARGEAQRYLEQAEGYKQSRIAEATGEADRFNKLYVEYELAPEVTRERIYLDTIESVMRSSTKVMIDVEGGNNLLYLPLDKIMQQNQAPSESTSSERTSSLDKSSSNSRRDRR